MTAPEAIAWFKSTFGKRIAAAVKGTPFSVDLLAAIAYQETGYIWSLLLAKGLPEADILRLCVGDTLDEDRGRSAFPRNKAELVGAPRGAEMFQIARQALLDVAEHIDGYRGAARNPAKFCHGFGLFQYDLQFFEENPAFFLDRAWADFDACLAQFMEELRAAARRQRWRDRSTLSDDEQVYVAIAYNKGSADCTQGFKQGHRSDDGRCYGENVYDFFHLAQQAPLGGRYKPAKAGRAKPAAAAAMGTAYEVRVTKSPLRLRSEPRVPSNDPGANVVALLPNGQLVEQVSPVAPGADFINVETVLDGKQLRGFAAAKFLRLVKRAIPVGKEAGPERIKPAAVTESDLDAMIRVVQAKLGLDPDGRAGVETWKAIYTRVTGKKPRRVTTRPGPKAPSVAASGAVDPRSEKVIATLQPEVQAYARALVRKAAAVGITIKLISGLRTYEEQNELYAQGRTKPGRIVTNARGGYSNHNFGIAFDIGIFDGAQYVPESPRYKAVGALGVELGLEWGGNWKTIKDEPHFQLRPGWAADQPESGMLATLRARMAAGEALYA